ncbi:hypothetical protein NXY29_03365 [Bacteroides fragilis]|nr:hypothetical protein [Bacteroides fragilis]
MNNKRKNMSIYITVLLWILIPLLIINGLIFLTSDMLSVFVGGMLSLKLLCYSLFFSYSFLLGYKAQTGGGIIILVLLLILGLFLWQSFISWVEPPGRCGGKQWVPLYSWE